MRQILVHADSLSWGIVPNTRQRLAFDARWPGVLEVELASAGLPVRVIDDCLNGRRTVWDDPFKPGRNGLTGLEQRIESCSPLALVVLMLGTNDFQVMHATDPWQSSRGIAALVRGIRNAPIEPGMPVPEILVVTPPALETPKGPIAPKFRGADAKSVGLSAAYAQVARELGCRFFDAGEVTSARRVDGVHLDADQHQTLGRALAKIASQALSRS